MAYSNAFSSVRKLLLLCKTKAGTKSPWYHKAKKVGSFPPALQHYKYWLCRYGFPPGGFSGTSLTSIGFKGIAFWGAALQVPA